MRLALFISLMSLSLSASALQTSYPLLCRGPLTLSIAGGDFLADFNRSAGPGGNTGEALKPGECSWMDRSVATAEPNRLYVTMGELALPQTGATQTIVSPGLIGALFDKLSERQFLQQSLLSENVIIQLYVYNDGRYFKSETGKGTGRAYVIYPANKVADSRPVTQAATPPPARAILKTPNVAR